MVLALAELIAARNCWLQSENWTLAGAADEVAEGDVLAVDSEDDWLAVAGVLEAVLGRLEEVQAVPASSTAVTRADSRTVRRVAGTP
jgi:hypothetical protein